MTEPEDKSSKRSRVWTTNHGISTGMYSGRNSLRTARLAYFLTYVLLFSEISTSTYVLIKFRLTYFRSRESGIWRREILLTGLVILRNLLTGTIKHIHSACNLIFNLTKSYTFISLIHRIYHWLIFNNKYRPERSHIFPKILIEIAKFQFNGTD